MRTTVADVENLLGDNFGDGSATGILTAFIRTAGLVVDSVVTCAATRGITHSSDLLAEIEAYLAAHFYGHRDQFYTQKQTQNASASFQGKFGLALDGSQYGQTAMLLDTSRCLAGMSKGGKIGLAWLGKTFNEQIDVLDRA